MKKYQFISDSAEFTASIGGLIAPLLCGGDVILLKGDLGAGKTTFTSGVAKRLHVEERVISPTFNIMKCYFDGDLPLYHIDAYRLENQNLELGLDEYIEGDGVCLIEWPMYIEKLLPDEYLEVILENQAGNSRLITIISNNAHYDEIVSKIEEALS